MQKTIAWDRRFTWIASVLQLSCKFGPAGAVGGKPFGFRERFLRLILSHPGCRREFRFQLPMCWTSLQNPYLPCGHAYRLCWTVLELVGVVHHSPHAACSGCNVLRNPLFIDVSMGFGTCSSRHPVYGRDKGPKARPRIGWCAVEIVDIFVRIVCRFFRNNSSLLLKIKTADKLKKYCRRRDEVPVAHVSNRASWHVRYWLGMDRSIWISDGRRCKLRPGSKGWICCAINTVDWLTKQKQGGRYVPTRTSNSFLGSQA